MFAFANNCGEFLHDWEQLDGHLWPLETATEEGPSISAASCQSGTLLQDRAVCMRF